MIPMPVRVMVWAGAWVRHDKLTLRDLVMADDPEAIDPPRVEEIVSPALGTGLVASRLRAMRDESPPQGDAAVFAVLRYGFPVPGHDDMVLVTVAWPDLARVAAARGDIDSLARGITFEYHPDEPGA
jgi:hypothetical protein